MLKMFPIFLCLLALSLPFSSHCAFGCQHVVAQVCVVAFYNNHASGVAHTVDHL